MLAIAKSNHKNSRASMQVRPGQPKNYVGLQLFCKIQTSYTKNPKQFNKQLTGNEYNARHHNYWETTMINYQTHCPSNEIHRSSMKIILQ